MQWTEFELDGLVMRDFAEGCAMVGTDVLDPFAFQVVIIFNHYEVVVHNCKSVRDAKSIADRLIGTLTTN